jgi:hypothetical protein
MRLLGNVAVLLALAVGLPLGIDALWAWLGGSPFLSCWSAPWVALLLRALPFGLALVAVGWMLSWARRGEGIATLVLAALLYLPPEYVPNLLGAYCG